MEEGEARRRLVRVVPRDQEVREGAVDVHAAPLAVLERAEQPDDGYAPDSGLAEGRVVS